MYNKREDGRVRVVIENVKPCVDGGAFPIKRVLGEAVTVWADCFCDGHDMLGCRVIYRKSGSPEWEFGPMEFVDNDRWRGGFEVSELGDYEYGVEAWVDHFLTWRHGLKKKYEARCIDEADYTIGLSLLERAHERVLAADMSEFERLRSVAAFSSDETARFEAVYGDELLRIMNRAPDTELSFRSDPPLRVTVDRKRASFSSWYEFFPRSCTGNPARHGTLRDAAECLPKISAMGFDVVYLPPVHPIGEHKRKGKNNSAEAAANDPGSPWAIGSRAGGHKSIEPHLGNFDDFERFLAAAQKSGLEIALDIAFQCAPDHPYVNARPQWFNVRPDGTIQFAENPPKKYEDIIPFNFETGDWEALWDELKSVVLFWIDKGVRIFRVDNPHTKPFIFWQRLISDVKREYPETLFLSEAFTRPKVMNRLAKIGFSQSYTYFTWRNSKTEITRYMSELTKGELKEYFRPNFWPNTPDILPQILQFGGENAFVMRLVLAATLSSSYGIYGPAFEQAVSAGSEGKEEYENSEKYEIYAWDRSKGERITAVITALNKARHENSALQSNRFLEFYHIDNDYMLFYGKRTADLTNIILVVVNLDPFHVQKGRLKMPLYEFGIEAGQSYLLEDLLTGSRYVWHEAQNEISLDPAVCGAAVFKLERKLSREVLFEYY
ncbi:MAG: alpha-1,4-glucan--maltose-1-phosphate maltosyltransferase [Chitinispirillales bacterium]|jgi:starch synthase (maltosyl-transferring)|nr:alpha-1,4-glucan--maltose-1-phosphate maltosyltransferase [Chitinispirillales bacterium]